MLPWPQARSGTAQNAPPMADSQPISPAASPERLKRWRLMLGGEEDATGAELGADDLAVDGCLNALYGNPPRSPSRSRRGGLGASAPGVARWLGDIRGYFPSQVVQVMQKDAMERLGLKQLLTEPEILQSLEPDVHLVATLVSLGSVIPQKSRATARSVVARVVEELMRRLDQPTRQAVLGSLARNLKKRRPRQRDVDWLGTIRANLKHYQPEQRTVIPEQLVGFGRRRSSLADLLLCVDQSGSMATSVVYAGIFAAVLAGLPSVSTRMVAFDTAVVDLTEQLSDPVELLFGVQLGGGTDINRALAYCQGLVTRPQDTVLVLISDLFEGGKREQMLKRAAALISSGVRLVALLSLSDDGAPAYDHENAAVLASLGAPTFACTPELFPELMAAALRGDDLQLWASTQGLVTARA